MSDLDPASLQVLLSRLSGVAGEMGAVLRRAAFSPNIKERADCSAALFSASGELLAQAEHIPVHLGSMPASVRAAIDAFGSSVAPGSQVVLNDPFAGGTHLNDITLVAPCWVGGSLVGWVANRAHHADVGGAAPGSIPADAVEVYQEGLRLPPVLFTPDVRAVVLANSRTPVERAGDLDAQVGANILGVARLAGLVEAGAPFDEVLAYGERRMRAALAAMPDGSWTFSDVIDSCGPSEALGQRDPASIVVRVTVDGDSVLFDFTGTSPQRAGNVNAVEAVTVSAVSFVLRSVADPTIPANGGAMRPVRVVAPLGSLVAAVPPVAVGAGNVEVSQRIADVCFGALAFAVPGRVGAASQGTMNNVLVGGDGWVYYETVAGGQGARPGRAGMSGVHTGMTNTLSSDPRSVRPVPGMSGVHTGMTNTRNTPTEALERAFPMRVLAYRLRRGSGGVGLAVGGEGIERDVEMLEDATVSLITERRRSHPWGLAGGGPGARGENWLLPGGVENDARRLPDKVTLRLARGDVLRMLTPGGGGWGFVGPATELVMLGVSGPGSIELAEHTAGWADQFEAQRARLAGVFGGPIEHVGSTSIAGIVAKPIVDISVAVDDPEDDASVLPAMTALGYVLRVIEPGHRMYATPERDVQVHLWQAGSAEFRHHVLFRDYLRASPEDRSLYERVKRQLAEREWEDRNDYADAKGDVVMAILHRAEQWAVASGWSPAD